MTLPGEATILRWGATLGFLACAVGALWMLGLAFAPWVALVFGTLAFGIPAGAMWSKQIDTEYRMKTPAQAVNRSSRVYDPDEDDD